MNSQVPNDEVSRRAEDVDTQISDDWETVASGETDSQWQDETDAHMSEGEGLVDEDAEDADVEDNGTDESEAEDLHLGGPGLDLPALPPGVERIPDYTSVDECIKLVKYWLNCGHVWYEEDIDCQQRQETGQCGCARSHESRKRVDEYDCMGPVVDENGEVKTHEDGTMKLFRECVICRSWSPPGVFKSGRVRSKWPVVEKEADDEDPRWTTRGSGLDDENMSPDEESE